MNVTGSRAVLLFVADISKDEPFFTFTRLQEGFSFDTNKPLNQPIGEQVGDFLNIYKHMHPDADLDTSIETFSFFSWRGPARLDPETLFSEVPDPWIVLSLRANDLPMDAARMVAILQQTEKTKEEIDKWFSTEVRSRRDAAPRNSGVMIQDSTLVGVNLGRDQIIGTLLSMFEKSPVDEEVRQALVNALHAVSDAVPEDDRDLVVDRLKALEKELVKEEPNEARIKTIAETINRYASPVAAILGSTSALAKFFGQG